MILACNLGTPSLWFRNNSLSATAHAEDDYLQWGRTPNRSQLQGKVFQAISNNPKLQALILGFDYFSTEVMQITNRCLYTGITLKLCDQSNKQTEQFSPLFYFPRGSASYDSWPASAWEEKVYTLPDNTVEITTVLRTDITRTRNRLYRWQKENQAEYRTTKQAQELRDLNTQLFYEMRQLTRNSHTQERLNKIARAYHLADPEHYLLREIDINGPEAQDFCFDVFEMQLPNTIKMTEQEEIMAWYQCLYYLSTDIEPTRQVTLRIRYAPDRANRFRVFGSVSVPVK